MAAYLALQIGKGKLDYKAVVKLYSQFKNDIDMILVADGYHDLIEKDEE